MSCAGIYGAVDEESELMAENGKMEFRRVDLPYGERTLQLSLPEQLS